VGHSCPDDELVEMDWCLRFSRDPTETTSQTFQILRFGKLKVEENRELQHLMVDPHPHFYIHQRPAGHNLKKRAAIQ